jgi:hypothetical protein
VFLKRSHRTARASTPMWHITFESSDHVLLLQKIPACPKPAQAEQIAFEIEDFFQPAGFFTEMLRFDKNKTENSFIH